MPAARVAATPWSFAARSHCLSILLALPRPEHVCSRLPTSLAYPQLVPQRKLETAQAIASDTRECFLFFSLQSPSASSLGLSTTSSVSLAVCARTQTHLSTNSGPLVTRQPLPRRQTPSSLSVQSSVVPLHASFSYLLIFPTDDRLAIPTCASPALPRLAGASAAAACT